MNRCILSHTLVFCDIETLSTKVSTSASQHLPKPKELGARLRHERQRLGLSQQVFGEIGGVQRVTQYLYEQGDRSPSIEYLLKVVRAGANLGYIAFGESGSRTAGGICLDRNVLATAYRLADEFGRDTKGRLLDVEYRAALFEAICSSVAHQSPKSIDWDEVRNNLKQSAA